MTPASPPAFIVRARRNHAAVSVLAAALVCLLASCSHAPAPGSSVHQTLALGLNQSARLDDGAELRFANVVNDSRCPAGVTCVWAGTATIRLQLVLRPGVSSDAGAVDVLAVLPGSVGPDDVASLLPVDTFGYSITLLRLTPEPTVRSPAGAATARPQALLHIVKANP